MPRPVFRFAPSPNGRLHLGHALSALLNAEAARRTGGRFLLRIEDIDPSRAIEAHVAGVLNDVAWLGLAWEQPVHRQSEHMAAYREAFTRLKAAGLVYPCFATRGEITAAVATKSDWPCDPDGAPLYPGLWRGAAPGAVAAAHAAIGAPAWRLDMTKALAALASGPLSWTETGAGLHETIAADCAAWGDVVLLRKEVPTSYHLSVVVDDARQGITHVVRGRDLYHATSVHVLLQRLLGLPSPLYHHHRLILGPDGRKLSKSRGSESLHTLRTAGATPDDVRRLVNWAPDRDLALLSLPS
jgi:glutamyl-Q tRNA(Asp) synthetase